MINEYIDVESCCGCGACVAACSHNSIMMFPNAAGFLYPVVDEMTCKNCGLCVRVCPVLSSSERDSDTAVFWAKAKDGNHLISSSSGGVFGLLAKRFLEGDSAVYGAAFADKCRVVRHVRVDDVLNLDSIMRSKYVQSEISLEIYRQVETDIRNGKYVLFSGTACQVSGIRKYLLQKRLDISRLLLVDVICHGVPSPKLWAAWLDFLVENEGSKIDSVNFRSKSTGWLTFSLSYKHESEKVNTCRFSSDWYMKAFLSNASLRPSCFRCLSKRSCGSDITLGDFWGIQSVHSEINYENGISAVIANTEKGLTAFELISELIDFGDSGFSKVVFGNPALIASVEPFSEYASFMDAIKKDCDIRTMHHRWNFEPSSIQKLYRKLRTLKQKLFS
ncbi:Coenzyme F420 hydrogenase/dehydrogenase, beta subunit C-terminal domain [Adlercreutzia sp. ZJ154]|uniref:Coenzyme F420 hydrogenase/dehydrogenase, beta subunit C-terminal domain n=1 Tax=Adlercreutzia sp. ZJ154 TaxID=2709790 RepID=UPI0013EA4D0B|nr:Coenzyme F420 hydrogenase/dehydrogenase, beta subunit C-terminal domain [Adlercreutzia sp. ZJ154]